MLNVFSTSFHLKHKKMTRLILSIAFTLFGLMANAQTDSINNTTPKTQTSKHELKGKATFYGSQYKSTRKTANGECFNKNTYTAAHKTLPFGTMVRVTNIKNGKSVTVRITDRGPFGPGRIIDVTPVAARDLDMVKAGVVPCELEILSWPPIKKKNRT